MEDRANASLLYLIRIHFNSWPVASGFTAVRSNSTTFSFPATRGCVSLTAS